MTDKSKDQAQAETPLHDGWRRHVEHGVEELKKRGLTKAQVVKIAESAYDDA